MPYMNPTTVAGMSDVELSRALSYAYGWAVIDILNGSVWEPYDWDWWTIWNPFPNDPIWRWRWLMGDPNPNGLWVQPVFCGTSANTGEYAAFVSACGLTPDGTKTVRENCELFLCQKEYPA